MHMKANSKLNVQKVSSLLTSEIPGKIYYGQPRELSYEKLLTWSVTGQPYARFDSKLGFELELRD